MARTLVDALAERLNQNEHQSIGLEDAPRRAAVVGLIARGPEPSLLVIKRAEHPADPWSGHMGLPGGRVEEGESDLGAAIREVQEEVGLDLAHCAQLLGQIDDLHALGRGVSPGLAIAPFFFSCPERLSLQPDAREVAETHWVPLSFLRDSANLSSMEYDHRGETLELPCYRFAERCIWGLTLRMIQGLLSLAPRVP